MTDLGFLCSGVLSLPPPHTHTQPPGAVALGFHPIPLNGPQLTLHFLTCHSLPGWNVTSPVDPLQSRGCPHLSPETGPDKAISSLSLFLSSSAAAAKTWGHFAGLISLDRQHRWSCESFLTAASFLPF